MKITTKQLFTIHDSGNIATKLLLEEFFPKEFENKEEAKKIIIEAISRGYKEGNYRCLYHSDWTLKGVEDDYFFNSGTLWHGSRTHANAIFMDGVWAKIIK